ncbi:MAG: hypothetical protein RL385_5449, partial [Pseudomonadota bacterium]
MAPSTAELHPTSSEGWLHALWHKYGLIVVGNVVFFALLYFVQYRPNSRENRATELLTMAQREEAEGHLEAAQALYEKVTKDYADADAFAVAHERLPKVLALAKKRREVQPPLPESCAPHITIKEVLEIKPSLYLAELVAGYYAEVQPTERERYFAALDDYVTAALNRDHVPLDKLQKSPVFRAEELVKRYFAIKGSTRFEDDLFFDDFYVKNLSYFTLHNVVLDVTVTQGDSTKQRSMRVPQLAPGEEVMAVEFRVTKDGGAISVKVGIGSDEGKGGFEQRL